MSAEDRNAWVQVARQTLRGMPADLLRQGCAVARKTCKFASEIVPTIIEDVGTQWERRKREMANMEAQHRQRHMPRLERHEPEYVSAEEVRNLIASIGR